MAQIKTDIYVDRRVAAQPLETSLLQHAQQLGLQPEAEVAYFVEKQRALIGGFYASAPACHGSGKSAFFVPEEFVFDQRFRQIRA